MARFDELREQSPRVRKGRCRLCGGQTAGEIILLLRELPARRSVISRSTSLCEKHAIEIYESATKAMRFDG